MLNWPLLELCAHVALKWYILRNPGSLYDERCTTQSLETHPAEGPILGIWTDVDLTRDLKIYIVSAHLKHLVARFRFPHRPSRCGHWFSSYRLGAFNNPRPPGSGGWRNTPATAGLTRVCFFARPAHSARLLPWNTVCKRLCELFDHLNSCLKWMHRGTVTLSFYRHDCISSCVVVNKSEQAISLHVLEIPKQRSSETRPDTIDRKIRRYRPNMT